MKLQHLRIAVKVLLCLSLLVSVGLVLNYIRNLNPTADGFDVGSLVARLVHGDGFWTWEKLTRGVYISCSAFAALFCADKALELAANNNKTE
ncbi:MAG: hypothetical protein IKV55_06315 [Oscillospiraceae bacterium]|nr:hypothetical protein [Oscillospiraceae bacterium]